jgi:hypothetical protein
MDWKRWLRLAGLVLLLIVLYFAAPVLGRSPAP